MLCLPFRSRAINGDRLALPGQAPHASCKVPRTLTFALHCALTGIALVAPGMNAHAQARDFPGIATGVGVNHYEIPAGPLSAGLNRLADQANVLLSASGTLTEGKNTPGLDGSYALGQAFSLLLTGTGLQAVRQNDGTYSLRKIPESGAAAVMPAITVSGTAESAYGPGNGYVATQSATATKSSTPIIEVPQAISVVTRQQMDDQRPQTVASSLRYSSGVTSEAYGVASNYTDSYLYVRGFRPDVYLDGMKQPPLSSTDPYFLERAELLHGPASVLYGQASPGGLVDLVSKRPVDTPLHEIEIGTGSYGRAQTNFDFGGPLDQDGTLLYRLTGTAHTADTQVDDNKDRRIAIAPALTWHPDAATTLTILASYTHDPDLGAFSALPAIGTVLPSRYGQISRSFSIGDPGFNTWKRDQASIGYLLEHRFDSVWTVRQNLRYSYLNSTERHLYGQGIGTDQRTISRYAYLDLNRRSSFDVDNQAEADFSTGPFAHKLLLGFDYQYLHVDETAQLGLAPSIDYLSPIYGVFSGGGPTLLSIPPYYSKPVTMQRQAGLYTQDQIKWNNLSLLLGVRQDWATSDVSDSIANTTTHMADSATTWRTGLVYEFANGIAPYIGYSTSFQPQSGTALGGAAFKPATGQQYEAGVKYQPAGYDSFITVSAFNLTQQNVLTPDPVNTAYKVQTGEIRSRGFEIEGHANLTRNLSLIASYTYLANVVTKANDSSLGKHPVAIPANMSSLWADYTFHSGALNGLGLSVGVRYVGKTYGTASNAWGIAGYETAPSKVPGYTLFDAAVRYDFNRNWQLSVNASNLFDRKYVSSCLSASTCYYGPGRLVLANIRYSW